MQNTTIDQEQVTEIDLEELTEEIADEMTEDVGKFIKNMSICRELAKHDFNGSASDEDKANATDSVRKTLQHLLNNIEGSSGILMLCIGKDDDIHIASAGALPQVAKLAVSTGKHTMLILDDIANKAMKIIGEAKGEEPDHDIQEVFDAPTTLQ